MIFLKLTTFNSARYPVGFVPTVIHGKPIIVNAAHIEAMEIQTSHVFETEKSMNIPVKERPTEDYTLITFAASSDGEAHTLWVVETPEAILAAIEKLGS